MDGCMYVCVRSLLGSVWLCLKSGWVILDSNLTLFLSESDTIALGDWVGAVCTRQDEKPRSLNLTIKC